MLVEGSNMQHINVLKKTLTNSFAVKDLGKTLRCWFDILSEICPYGIWSY
jgi:hypothetical protein